MWWSKRTKRINRMMTCRVSINKSVPGKFKWCIWYENTIHKSGELRIAFEPVARSEVVRSWNRNWVVHRHWYSQVDSAATRLRLTPCDRDYASGGVRQPYRLVFTNSDERPPYSKNDRSRSERHFRTTHFVKSTIQQITIIVIGKQQWIVFNFVLENDSLCSVFFLCVF